MLLTVKEVSKELRVNVNYVYKLINAGLLPSIKLGSIKVREETLKEFIKSSEGKDVDARLNENGNNENACK